MRFEFSARDCTFAKVLREGTDTIIVIAVRMEQGRIS